MNKSKITVREEWVWSAGKLGIRYKVTYENMPCDPDVDDCVNNSKDEYETFSGVDVAQNILEHLEMAGLIDYGDRWHETPDENY